MKILIDNQQTQYEIFQDGRLFNRKNGHYYKGNIRGGYLYYDLRFNHKKISKAAHRLVAEYFIQNPDNLPIVNHKDGNKLNNNISNLEWISYSGNNYHAYQTGLKEKTNGVEKRIKYCDNDIDQKWLVYKDTIYLVSNKGRIRNMKTGNLLKGKITNAGYVEWSLCINHHKKSLLAHRVVYQTFVQPLQDGLVINHIDGVKTNNQVNNLQQVSNSQNILKAYYDTKTHHLRRVGKYSTDLQLLQVYKSCADAAARNEKCYSNYISMACNGKIKIYKGYIWKYIEE